MGVWLNEFIGARLISASALFHVFESGKDKSPQELELFFSTGNIRFYGSGDGGSLCFSPVSILECDLGDYGKLELNSVSDQDIFSGLLDEKLISISFVRALGIDTVVGIVLFFSESNFLSILNIDDELFVFDVIPEEFIEFERLVVEPAIE